MKTIERLKTQGFRSFTEKDFNSFAGASKNSIIKEGKHCSYIFSPAESNENVVMILFGFEVDGEFSSAFVSCPNICNFCEIEEAINEALGDLNSEGWEIREYEGELYGLFGGWGLKLKNLTI